MIILRLYFFDYFVSLILVKMIGIIKFLLNYKEGNNENGCVFFRVYKDLVLFY